MQLSLFTFLLPSLTVLGLLFSFFISPSASMAATNEIAHYFSIVSDHTRPQWLRLSPGIQVVLGAEGIGQTSAFVCATLDDLSNGPNESCTQQPANETVIIRSFMAPEHGITDAPVAHVIAANGRWEGYTWMIHLIPIP